MSRFPYRVDDLPGGVLVARGIEDLSRGVLSTEALLAYIASPALASVGADLPALPSLDNDAELVLYRQLQKDHPESPYSRYNALLRQLVSFTRACAPRARSARSAR